MSHGAPTNATQAKDRHYAQLANSLTRMSQALNETAFLFSLLQTDLDAMKTIAGHHAAQFMAVGDKLSELVEQRESEDEDAGS